jgi:hypothetical protein
MRLFKLLHSRPRFMRIAAVWCMLTMITDVIYPTAAWALTSGPSQPEFSSFEPVVTTNMVNEFSGDLTYNLPVLQIPGPNGGGYALSLSYHSGASPEEDASWVGYGWTLNPGALNRQLQGYPDDWADKEVTSYNKGIPAKTVSVSGFIQPEGFSYDLPFNADGTIRYNNYTGFGYTVGAALVLGQGVVSLGFHVTDGEGSFSLAVNPAALLKDSKKEQKKKEEQYKAEYESLTCDNAQEKAADQAAYIQWRKKDMNKGSAGGTAVGALNSSISAYGTRAMASPSFPLSSNKMSGNAATLSIGFVPTLLPLQVGVSGNVTGKLVTQTSEPVVTRRAFGYLNMQAGRVSDENALDYHVENATTYNKRDKFLPLPINDADLFVASGEGISGSMRFYNNVPGQYRPPYEESETWMEQIGGEINLGLNTGGSVDAGIGHQTLTVEEWQSPSFTQDQERSFLRMSNDKGGWATYGNSDAPQAAGIDLSGVWGFQSSSASGSLGTTEMNDGQRSGMSSYVGYHTNAQMELAAGGVHYMSYEKRPLEKIVHGSQALQRSDLPQDQIGEVAVLNASGQRYVYGLPVYAAGEQNISYAPIEDPDYNPVTTHNHWATSIDPESSSPAKNGQSVSDQYASSFLLTSIVDADFIDRSNNGPTPDDFGGYTRFVYHNTYGRASGQSSANWYHWRMPYNGYSVNRGSLSECHDDRLSFTDGRKEIYLLDSVVTKSHVAVFKLNTDPRQDGLAASVSAGTASNARDENKKLNYLDRIELYSRQELLDDPNAKPIKTVRFEYDYSSWTNSPNTVGGNQGKLTLTRVWFEYNGTVPATIAPYEFSYTYPHPSGGYPVSYVSDMDANLFEDPEYDQYCSDAWGAYRCMGSYRCDSMQTWNDQSPERFNGTDTHFDPAAYQLKVIRMPSGGEIHVQYEQDDYAHVQSDRAHVMAHVTGPSGIGYPGFYEVSLRDLSPDVNDDPQTNIDPITAVQLIRSLYVGQSKKLYFKFLYELRNASGSPDLQNSSRNKEYITGYSTIENAMDVAVSALDPQGHIRIRLGGSDGHSLPPEVCNDLYNAEKRGKDLGSGCDCGNTFLDGSVSNTGGSAPKDVILSFLDFVSSIAVDNCIDLSYEHSFMRIPVPDHKLGGGLRVKKLLTYDPQGDADGYPSVFGQEYIYRALDESGREISSGVATNEPQGLHEENVLVRPLDRFHQSWFSQVVAGRDKKQSEGPIGASAYPSASVGYSQIIVKNIYSGKTKPVFTVKNFHTAKDYPVQVEMTDMDDRTDTPVRIITGIVNIIKDHATVSQGYAIKLNEMHGQPKREATYHGDHTSLLEHDDEVYAVLSSSTEYEYFQPGESLPIMTDQYGSIGQAPLGKETDVTVETRTVRDEMDDASIEVDFGVSVALIAIFPSFSFMVSTNTVNSRIDEHATTKIITHPAVVKRTKVLKDGIYHVTQNMAFDPRTGEPCIVRTHDGFYPNDPVQQPDLSATDVGTYTAHTVPASMVYPAMAQAAKGEGKVMYADDCPPYSTTLNIGHTGSPDLHALHFDVNTPGASVCDALNAMCVGDLFEITAKADCSSSTTSTYLYTMTNLVGSDVAISRISYSSAIPSGARITKLRIVRSGCGNQLDQNAGLYTLYGSGGVTAVANAERVARQNLVDQLNWHIQDIENTLNDNCTPTPDPCNACSPVLQPCTLGVVDRTIPISTAIHWGANGLPCGSGSVIHLYAHPGPQLAIGISCGDVVVCEREFPIIGIAYPNPNGPDPAELHDWGYFALGAVDNSLVFFEPGNDCCPIPVECPQFDELYNLSTADNVVACNATVFSDLWPYEDLDYAFDGMPTGQNAYETGRRGQWRVDSSFSYLTGLNAGYRNHERGLYHMDVFNWDAPVAIDQDKWKLTNYVEAYSPDGNGLQEKNALGIQSCAKYGYSRQLPYLVAQNANLQNAHFESFENSYSYNSTTYLEDRLPFWDDPENDLDHAVAHSGRSSNRHTVASPSEIYVGKLMPVTNVLQTEGVLIKAWFRSITQGEGFRDPVVSAAISEPGIPSHYVSGPMRFVARSGEWGLYEILIKVPSGWSNVRPEINASDGPNMYTWIDDVRIQPGDAKVTTYVYDPSNFRLMASFDDQNFGLYYQYNDEGKLVRKLIETERGMRTIQETQYNMPTPLVHP